MWYISYVDYARSLPSALPLFESPTHKARAASTLLGQQLQPPGITTFQVNTCKKQGGGGTRELRHRSPECTSRPAQNGNGGAPAAWLRVYLSVSARKSFGSAGMLCEFLANPEQVSIVARDREESEEEMERPMRIELTPEPWQGSVLPLY